MKTRKRVKRTSGGKHATTPARPLEKKVRRTRVHPAVQNPVKKRSAIPNLGEEQSVVQIADEEQPVVQTIVEKQEAIVDLLAGTQPINPAFSSEIKEQVDKVKEKLKEEYTNQTSTPPAPYVAWVKEQKDTCLAVEKILLPEHPPLAESLQATLAAAERLEAAAAA